MIMTQKKTTPRVLLVLYTAMMLWLLFFQSARIPDYHAAYWLQVKSNLNLVPFRTVSNYLHILMNPAYYLEKLGFASMYTYQVRQAVINLGGNVGMFIPLGLLLPCVFDKLRKCWKVLLATAAIITLVEIAQLFSLLGSCDVDDLILNILGSAIGYAVWYGVLKKGCA
jgi:glycopeptide antibiotics resistance protein